MPACAGMTLLTACAGGPTIRHQVLTPPPSAPRAEFFLEQVDVQSREVGEEAWQRNRAWGDVLGEALRAALQARGKALVAPPADIIRAKVYLAYGPAPVKLKDSIKAKAHVEVRLQLLEAGSNTVRYSTHTQTPIPAPVFGWGPEPGDVIREVLEKSAQDFASRL